MQRMLLNKKTLVWSNTSNLYLKKKYNNYILYYMHIYSISQNKQLDRFFSFVNSTKYNERKQVFWNNVKTRLAIYTNLFFKCLTINKYKPWFTKVIEVRGKQQTNKITI